MNRDRSNRAGWTAFLGLTALAVSGSMWSFGSVAANSLDGPQAAAPAASLSAGNWDNAFAGKSGVSIVTDGNFLVDVREKPQDVPLTRMVSRLKVNRFGKAAQPYRILVTANQKNQLTEWPYAPATRPAPESKAITEESSEMTITMPEQGLVVVSGSAPIILVKKATVSSEGTKFAIEADGTGWLLSVLEATNGPVLVYFPESGQRPKTCVAGQCWRFENDATLPTQGVDKTGDGTCTNLTNYATTILNATNF